MEPALRIVPASESSPDDLQTVFGPRGEAHSCQCQWVRLPAREYRAMPVEERRERFHEQAAGGTPSGVPSGLVAYLGDDPVGWVAVEPRSAYRRLRTGRVVWPGRDENPDDDTVWAITCFVVRTGWRRRGISRELAAAAVEHARRHGARAVEGYPLELDPGREQQWGELFVGSPGVFAAAGMVEVSRPTPRRRVMRVEL